MNRDFRDLLAEFNVQGVDFIIVGAHALAAHGHIRATQDFDVWVRPEAENAKRVYRALQEFGAPLQDLTEADLATPGIIFQIGVAIDGVKFPEAWANRMSTKFDDQPASVLSKEDLIRNKRAAGRTQDLADLERLEGRGKKS